MINMLPFFTSLSFSRIFKSLRFAACICLITLITVTTAFAQFGISGQDVSQMRSQDVSDDQLRMAVQRAEQEGYTIEQALQLARQQGLPAMEAERFRQRIRTLDMSASSMQDMNLGGNPLNQQGQNNIQPRFTRPARIETELMRRTFGSDMFRERQTEFTPSWTLPTPASYTLGPGDMLTVNIWGDQTNLHQLTVSPEGTVDIDNLGPVFVNGLNINEANDRIITSLQQIYAGLRPGSDNQTTFAQVSINRLRSIQVSMIGEVVNPGDYTVSSNSTVFNALYRAGGPGENGSYRNIRVIRDNEVVAVLDLYDYLVDGLQTNNIRLRDQDVIHITPYQNRVFVEGELKRSDLFFEMKEGETLDELIRFGGFFSDRAYTNQINIRRNTPTERRMTSVDQNSFDSFRMQSGDEVIVTEILDRFENRVTITGAVWRSGEFELTDGMTLYTLIQEADGLRPDAFLSRGLINRLRDDYRFEQLNFDVAAVMENPEQFDIPLKREDQIQIRSIHELNDDQEVQIDGAVRNPGTYVFRENMSLEDLILQADGFTNEASEAHIEISRRIVGEAAPEQRGQQLAEIFSFEVGRNLQLSDQDAAYRLQPFDQVYIHQRPDYQQQQTVRVEGQVMYPGEYTIRDRNERISDIVRRAGGLTVEAYLPGARLIRQYSSIDRPTVQFDFLTSDDVIDEDSFSMRDSDGMVEEEADTVSLSEINRELRDSQGVENRRTAMNRENFIESTQDSLIDADLSETETPVAIDLEMILEDPGSIDDLFLREGDILRIPEELQTVAVAGAVMQDVEVRYRPGMNLRDYINQAGGFAANARQGRVYIIYPNGDVNRKRQYLFGLITASPPIEPGSQIIIPAKAPRERMDFGELISVSAAIVGMTTSLIIALDRLSR